MTFELMVNRAPIISVCMYNENNGLFYYSIILLLELDEVTCELSLCYTAVDYFLLCNTML